MWLGMANCSRRMVKSSPKPTELSHTHTPLELAITITTTILFFSTGRKFNNWRKTMLNFRKPIGNCYRRKNCLNSYHLIIGMIFFIQILKKTPQWSNLEKFSNLKCWILMITSTKIWQKIIVLAYINHL